MYAFLVAVIFLLIAALVVPFASILGGTGCGVFFAVVLLLLLVGFLLMPSGSAIEIAVGALLGGILGKGRKQ
jgi:hypothetical protein